MSGQPDRTTVSGTLRGAIEASPATRYRISQETGVSEAALSRFMSGERGLSLRAVDSLASFLGLALLPLDANGSRARKER